MRDLRSLVVLAATTIAPPGLAGSEVMTLNDISVLHESRSWSELLHQAPRVPPRERTGQWRVWVAEAAEHRLKTLAREEIPVEAFQEVEHLLRTFDWLAGSASFMSARAEFGRKVFPRCFELTHPSLACAPHLEAFIAKDPGNRELAFWAGQLVARNTTTKWLAMPMFYPALRGLDEHPRCTDETVEAALTEALSLKTGDPRADRTLDQAREIAFGPCWSALKTSLLRTLPLSEAMMGNTCRDFEKKNALSGLRARKCRRVLD